MRFLLLCIATAVTVLSPLPQTVAADKERTVFYFEPGKLLLFAIKAGIGKNALNEFQKKLMLTNTWIPSKTDHLPDLYRSRLLDRMPFTIREYRVNYMVAEMRKAGKTVARVTFDVSKDIEKVDLLNWFSVDRLVYSYPYEIGKGKFVYFSVIGRTLNPKHFWRTFHIMDLHNGCEGDIGFMGIGEGNLEECDWMRNEASPGFPVLFYSTMKGVPFAKSVAFADNFVIYGTHENVPV